MSKMELALSQHEVSGSQCGDSSGGGPFPQLCLQSRFGIVLTFLLVPSFLHKLDLPHPLSTGDAWR